MRFITLALCAAVILLAAMASPASAAITIGSDLTVSDGTASCDTPCTGVGTAPPGPITTSPIKGVVVRWRVGDGVGQLTFRVARPAGDSYPGDDTHTGVGRSQTVTVTTPPSDGDGGRPVISTFPTRVPIGAGDHIGVDLASTSELGFRDRSGVQAAIFA